MAQENAFGIVSYLCEPEDTEELQNLSDANNSRPIIPTLEEWCSVISVRSCPLARSILVFHSLN